MRWDWESTVRRVYAGKGDRESLARDIVDVIIGEGEVVPENWMLDLEGKRNLKITLIEGLLEEEGIDGFWFIWMMNHLRNEIRVVVEERGGKGAKSSGLKAIGMLLEEWDNHTGLEKGSPMYHDTLFYVLCKIGASRERRASALIMQARRARYGSAVHHQLSQTSQALIRLARAEIANPGTYSDDSGHASSRGKGESVSFLPPEHLDLEIELQELLALARFSDMGKTERKAAKVEGILDSRPGLAEYPHRPDMIVRFWTCQVRHRIASHTIDLRGFLVAKDEMSEIRDELERVPEWGALGRYIFDRLSQGDRRTKPGVVAASHTGSHYDVKHGGIAIVEEFTKDWRSFRRNEKKGWEDFGDATDYKRMSRALQGLNKYIHLSGEQFPIKRPEFLKHSRAKSNPELQKVRSGKVLAEISHARHMVMQYDSAQSFALLELLHRLLVYRLWSESEGWVNWERDACFSTDHASEVLEELRRDMLSIATNRVRKRVNKSIDESQKHITEGHEGLGTRIERFERDGDRLWANGDHVLGIPILPEGGNAYSFPDPWRSYVGHRQREDFGEYRR